MRVLMQGRLDLNNIGGGDKVQIEQTAHELRKLGVDVVISTNLSTDYSGFDLIHLFQLDWTPETFLFAKKAKKANKPLVLSPIHHSVEEVKKFDQLYAFGLRRLSKLFFKNQFKRDTLKNIYRSLFNYKKIYPTVISVIFGLQNIQRKALLLADMILVQTELEAKDLKTTYSIDIKWHKIPNGVGSVYVAVEDYKNPLTLNNYIFCVGRIEPRKNQLTLIEAVDNLRNNEKLDLNLIFVGQRNSSHHIEYNRLFDLEVKNKPWVKYLGYVPYKEMPSYFHFAKVGVSASWFETSGLTSLEALYCGANTVASGDRAKEYLGDFAFYCKPYDIKSIEVAISKAYHAPRPSITESLKDEYTWATAARKTLKVYDKVLG